MDKSYQDCQHFFKNKNEKATCNLCGKILSTKGGASIGLRRHLDGVHGYKREEPSTENNNKRIKSDETITIFLKIPTMAELVSKLAVVDGFSFNKIPKSEFIRQNMHDKGFKLPRNPTDVMKLMTVFFNDKKEELVKKINDLKFQQKKFCISIDEWTGANNKRYMDVHMYCSIKDSYNLGLIPLNGSCPAEKALELV